MLKDLVSNLEQQKEDLNQQNKLLKLKLLTSEDVRKDQDTASTQQAVNAAPQQAPSNKHNDSMNALHTALLTSVVNMVNSITNNHSHQPKITNIYNPNGQYHGRRRTYQECKRHQNWRHNDTDSRQSWSCPGNQPPHAAQGRQHQEQPSAAQAHHNSNS